jgi:sulfite exporter TauE/SafE
MAAMPIDLLVLSAAVLSGVFGGAHCVAMCGGLATSLGSSRAGASSWQHALWLNVGRIGGYTVAGALVGGIGSILWRFVRIEGLAIGVRSLVGLVLLLVAARMLFPMRFTGLTRLSNAVWQRLRPWRDRLVPDAGIGRPLVMGLFWGWLPCGLSTTLLMAAWLEASALHGGLLMLAFGLGTLPLMTMLSWSGAHFSARLSQPAYRRFAAGFIAVAGSVTLIAPWLVNSPASHAWLQALGCRAIIAG